MGFYSPEVIVRDAKRHEVEVLPVDINKSGAKCIIQENKIRLGFMYIRGVGGKIINQIIAERGNASYVSLEDFYLRTKLKRRVVENLILASAFDSFGYKKRELLWQLGLLEKRRPGELPLEFHESKISLPDFTELEEMKIDYGIQGFPLKYHPMQVLRKGISRDGLLKSSEIAPLFPNTQVRMAGYGITRQRPATAKGFAFMTLEDEEGTVNVIIKPRIYEKYRQVFELEPLVVVEGIIQKRDDNLNIIAEKLLRLRKERERQDAMYLFTATSKRE
jgi:error-prone DNA polymerase